MIILSIILLCRVLDLSFIVPDQFKLLVRLSPGLVKRHVRSVFEEAHLGRVTPVLGADHDQTLELHVAAERNVEEELLVGVGGHGLKRKRRV
jgi:hypothetical protein